MKMAIFTDINGSRAAVNPQRVSIYAGRFFAPQADQEVGRPPKMRDEVRVVEHDDPEGGWITLPLDTTFEQAVAILDEALNWPPAPIDAARAHQLLHQ